MFEAITDAVNAAIDHISKSTPSIIVKRDKVPYSEYSETWIIFVNGRKYAHFSKDQNGHWVAHTIYAKETWLARWQAKSAAISMALKEWERDNEPRAHLS